jgi:predicted O-linked N-acetylglucosamine transferase (SPINDLY family)
MATISEALAIAIQHHQAGRLQAAEQIYRQILAAAPDQPDTIHLLGVMSHEAGRHDAAIGQISRAIALKEGEPIFHNNLGEAYRAVRKIPEAIACYRRALELKPDYAEAHCNLGAVLKQQGDTVEAIACCRRALELHPDFAEARNNLGTALKEQGNLDDAVACYRRALELKPDYAEAHNNLGVALREQGRLDDAVACYCRAVELNPNCAETHDNLGVALREQGRPDEAIACHRRALQLNPNGAAPHVNLGTALKERGNLREAAACFRRAVQLKPDFAEAHVDLGNALKEQGNLDEAIACYRRATESKPDYALAHGNLGAIFMEQGKLPQAIACFRRALELKPDNAAAHYNLGGAFKEQDRLDEAAACYRRVLEIRPDYAEAHSNLGSVCKDQGKLEEAIACYRRAVELKPDRAELHSNLLYALMFSPGYDRQALYAEHRRWGQDHARPLAKAMPPHANDRSAARRLRIGYVSPDIRLHPVGRFLLPLLESHDHEGFEIFCYASVQPADAVTERCRAHADVWRDVSSLSDEELARAVRRDKIDILVDLTMHMAKNRLLVFARKPAPVQATYLAYCGTTGLSAMDYRLTDPHLDPPGENERFYCEQSVRLPETYWCYRPTIATPPIVAPPALAAGHVTFGSLNNFCKVTPPVLAAWGRLLQAVPAARLLLHARAGSHRDRVWGFFSEQGISADRVEFVDIKPMTEYFGTYQRIDVALDPFPFGGGTTTCDALWMGVPVVSLVGQTAVGRGGLSILTNVGLPELAARSPEQYVQIAAELAGDLSRLSDLRATLRERMQSSPLMNSARFARHVEAAYRQMWRQWCMKER